MNKISKQHITAYMQDIPKKDYALILYRKYHSLPKKEMTDKFCEELFTSRKAAETYISLSAKALNNQLNKPYKTRLRDVQNSKKQKAYDLFVQNTELNRRQMINLFMSSLNMTDKSAATHCSMCINLYKKNFINKKHNTITE